MKVLVVDDDASMLELLRLSLAEAGHDVTVASSGDSAYALTVAEDFDAVVSDVDMPGMDGITLHRKVTAELRERGEPSPSFVLISGQARIIESLNTMELGVSDFLPKPFNIARLLAVMRQIEARREVRRSTATRDLARRLAAQPRMAIADLPEPTPLIPVDGVPFIGVCGEAFASVCERLSSSATRRAPSQEQTRPENREKSSWPEAARCSSTRSRRSTPSCRRGCCA